MNSSTYALWHALHELFAQAHSRLVHAADDEADDAMERLLAIGDAIWWSSPPRNRIGNIGEISKHIADTG